MRTLRTFVLFSLVAIAAVTGVASSAAAPKAVSADVWRLSVINDETIPGSGSQVGELRLGAQAAVAYLNAAKHGLKGRKLAIDWCDPHLDPGATSNCANQAVSDGVLAMVAGLALNMGANAVPVFAQANIPMWTQPISPAEFTTPNNFPVTGGTSAEFWDSINFMVKKLHMKNIALINSIQVNLNQSVGWAKAAGATTVTPVLINRAQTDFSPTAAQAARANPDGVLIVQGNASEALIIQALNAAGIPSSKILGIGPNADPGFLQLLGSAANGIRLVDELALPGHDTNPDLKLFLQAMKRYEPSAPIGYFTEEGFSDVMTMYAGASQIKGALTAAKLLAYFQSHPKIKIFLGPTYTAARNSPKCLPQWRQPLVQGYEIKNGTYVKLTKSWVGFGFPPC
jgi:branched-chain amino acid transport system substrate-binding protein